MQILQNVWTALTTENEVFINFISFPFSCIEIYLSMLLFLSLFKITSDKKIRIFYTLTFALLGSLSRTYIPEPYGTFINMLLCPILITIIFKVSVLKSILSELIPIIISTLIDLILFKLLHCTLHINNNDILNIPIYRVTFSLLEYISIFLVYIFCKHKSITINIDKFTNKNKLILTITSLLGTIAISTQMYICAYYIHILPIKLIVINISSLIAYFVLSIYSLINTNKLNIAKQNLEETKLMNKTLTILNDKIRAFRHDFNNIIQALGGYIQAKDIDGLEKYYSQLLKDCQEVTNLSGLNPESINNPAIYSLIASKYYLATEKGIEFDLDIFMDLTSIDMKIYEFCRILGILLDNAIQATQECEEKHIKVTIRKDNRCKRQLLIVENTYKEKDIDTEKIFEKGYSTKEGNTGLGLWEVRQILLKNTNLNLFTSKDDKYFKQQLEIYKG